VGELVVAKFKDDGSWYRAEVLSISSNGVICNFVDFGNSDMIPFSSVQRASALCRMIPKVAVKLKLFGVAEPQTWTENTQSVFDKIVSMDNARVIQMEVKSLNSDIVEVDFVDDSGRSASDLVCESMVLRQASIPETDDFVLASSVPLETIPVDGTQIEMMISEPMLSLNKCYLQKVIPKNVQIINLICEEINSYCISNSTPYHPIRGELVCAQFPADNVWYRAEVLEVDCDSYKVQFVDYGNVSVNSSEGLRKILKSIMAIPRQAVCCTLAGVDLSTLNTEQSDVFKASFIETIVKAEAQEMINESYSTTFFNKMDGTNINNLINSCRTIESTDVVMASTLSIETIPVDGNQIEALVMECYDMKYIYVQIVCEKCILQLETITAQLQEFCHSKSSSYVPMKGELVCALFVDDYWYRAEVLEVNGDDFTVFFVDYGNQANVKSSAIRKISSSLAITPKQSVCCNMVGVDFKKLPEEKILEFSKKTMNSQVVRLQGLQKKDGYYDVYLFSHQGENMNELLHTRNEIKTEKCCEQQPSVVPASIDVLMATALPMLTLPVDGQKTSLKLTDPTNLENLYFQKEDKHTLDLLSTQVCTYCQSNTTPYTPVIGELVCALYSADSTWYRAEVLDINEDDYLLQFFDYGNSETVKCNAIRIIDPTLITVPRLAVCCHLKGVDLTGLSEEKKLEFLTMAMSENVQVEAVGKHEHFYDVILYTSSGENINQTFLSQDMIEEPIQETPGVIMACTLSAKSLPLDGTKSDVFITDATSMDKIYLQFYGEENQQTQTDLLMAINRYCQDIAEPYSPTKGELVCAIFEKIWYRAEVLQVTGDTFKLLYVDYGNTADIKSDLICKIDKTLTTIPMQAVCCNVYQVDLKSLSPENIQLFAELVMGGKMIRVQALELIDRYYEVKLFTVDDICINDKFPRPAKELVPSLDTLFARSIPTVSLAVGGEQVDAVITEVMDDCTFHIQTDIAKSQLKLNEILGAVHQYCSTNTIPYKPVKGEMVCTQFSSDQVWYRAEVEDVMDDKYCVQYVDFGNREIVTEAVIRKIDPSLTKQPIQSVKCCLFDIPSANEVKTALISLKEVEINIKVVKKENEIYHVVIYTRNNIDIIEPLLYSTKAISDNKQIHKSVTTNTQFLCKDDAEKMQPKGDSFDVIITHVVSPVEIFCQLADPEGMFTLYINIEGLFWILV
jgi:tudor domain-containing protein 1/4/6/7